MEALADEFYRKLEEQLKGGPQHYKAADIKAITDLFKDAGITPMKQAMPKRTLPVPKTFDLDADDSGDVIAFPAK
jgi:hypothetical protein